MTGVGMSPDPHREAMIKADQSRNRASKWQSGDLLVVKGRNGSDILSYEDSVFQFVYKNTKRVPFGSKVLFLGKIQSSGIYGYANVWWGGEARWINLEVLRLVPQGKRV